MSAKSCRWINNPEGGTLPLGRNRFWNASDMLSFFTFERASAVEKDRKDRLDVSRSSGAVRLCFFGQSDTEGQALIFFLRRKRKRNVHSPKSWVTLNPFRATSAAIATTFFHDILLESKILFIWVFQKLTFMFLTYLKSTIVYIWTL